jgi:peptidoglycan/LPS O-acetylase OafA/YrhL
LTEQWIVPIGITALSEETGMRLSLETAAGFHLGYRRWLDGLRGVAILLVLAFHLGLLPGGSVGVDVFFVLSGFLITTLLAEEWQGIGSISLKQFYFRRALRLLPAFSTLLLLCFLSSVLLTSAPAAAERRREVLIAGCYVANWPNLHRSGMALLGHTWSLSVEEQFYLLWPVLLYGMLRLRMSRPVILSLVCTGIVVSAGLRLALYRLHAGSAPDKAATVMRLYMGLDTRADTLLVGCLMGLLAAWDLLPRSQRVVFWTGVASVASTCLLGFLAWNRCLDHSQYYNGLFTLVALMVAGVITRMLLAPSVLGSLLLESAPLVGTGRISYGLYLYHVPIIHWLRTVNPRWGWSQTLLAAALTFVAALLSSFVIERPCLRLKHRLRSWAEAKNENVILTLKYVDDETRIQRVAA